MGKNYGNGNGVCRYVRANGPFFLLYDEIFLLTEFNTQCAKRYVQQYSKVVKKATSKPDSHVQGHKSTREVHFANWIVPPLSASNDSLGFHKVFPRWLPFVFPYSSAGSLAICPTLGRKFLTTCSYGMGAYSVDSIKRTVLL